ncbi:MAG: hypothetical protein D6762_02865 [Candidatus Neomarinimicrobiota bacterium]|nr:MAG: hypothetical protein D6762_02865 [Candidatus Neomarinimicrobiota bacterium]
MSAIDKLVELQEIDSQLQELEALLGNLPEKVAELKAEEERLTHSVTTQRNRLKEIAVQLGKNELEIQSCRENIDKHKDQLSLVNSNRQYDAMMAEIEHLQSLLDQLETQNLELLEEKSEIETHLSSEEETLQSLSADLSERREKLEKRYAATAAEKEELLAAREAKVQEIDKPYLRQYDRVYQARDGLAVVPANGNACQGCGAVVPPQIMAEIKKGSRLHSCDVCGRFLYWET